MSKIQASLLQSNHQYAPDQPLKLMVMSLHLHLMVLWKSQKSEKMSPSVGGWWLGYRCWPELLCFY